MYTILGIDTGGTYTDGVIVRSESKEILCKTKALTTKNDLRVGIENCIAGLDPSLLRDIALVSLSTTIATNAIVEGHGCQEGLILIGDKPQGKIPTERCRMVRGRSDIHGRIIESVDSAELDEAIEWFRGQVDAMAVSGYASVRNPRFEIQVKERIQELLDVPVACAHELTSSLGFYNRTVTAALNAKLIPMVCDLIDSVGHALRTYRITAPLMIVKGDGTLMTELQARDKPIETILSGPAASVIGGKFLSGECDAVILDMGGTTTDLANIAGGKTKIRDDGAKVGRWFTHIKAAEVFTVGIGGNSRICIDSYRNLIIGPQRSLPFCLAGSQYPALRGELEAVANDEKKAFLNFWQNESEAYLLNRKYETLCYTDEEKALLDALADQPHTLHYLNGSVPMNDLAVKLDRLVGMGVLTRISATPTDILHASGEYREWDAEIAKLAVRIMAEQLGKSSDRHIADVRRAIVKILRDACIQSAFYFDGQSFEIGSDAAAGYFVNRVLEDCGSDIIGGSLFFRKKIVAIGAPVGAWMKGLEDELRTQILVPENAEVANAVGAAVGQLTENADILIRPDPVTKQFTAFTRSSRKTFQSLDEATAFAEQEGIAQGASHFANFDHETATEIEDVYDDNCMDNSRNFVERRVRVTTQSTRRFFLSDLVGRGDGKPAETS